MKKRSNAETRKPDILDNFYQLIIELGFEGTSIAKIAKRMNIHPSLIIHYFETKDKMTIALVEHVIEEYRKLIKGIVIDSRNHQSRLKKMVELFYSDQWYSITNISFDYSIISISFRNKPIFERLQKMYMDFKKQLVAELSILIEAKIITIKDPERVTEIIMSMVEGHRHFKHFYVDEKAKEKNRKAMIEVTLNILTS